MNKITAAQWCATNEKGELVLKRGTGSTNLVGVLPNGFIPVDQETGALVVAGMTSPVIPGNTLVAIGDSITHQIYPINFISSISRTNNVVTMVLANAPTFYFKGSMVDVVNVPEALAGVQTITGGSGTTWTYASVGPDMSGIVLSSNASAANMTAYSDNAWLTWANILTNQRFELLKVVAATGRTVGEGRAHIEEAVATGARAATVLLGINDILGGTPAETVIADLNWIYEYLLAHNIAVIAVTLSALGAPAYTLSRAIAIEKVNKFIRDKVVNTPGMLLADIYKEFVDPVNVNKGQAKANYTNSGDGVHHTPRGGFAAGKVFAAAVSNVFPFFDRRTTSNLDNYSADTSSNNVMPAGIWTNTGGTVNAPATGVAPAGFTALRNGSATVAYAVPLRADGFGYDISAAVTSTANNDGMRVHSGSPSLASIPAGCTLQLEWSVSVTGVAGSNFRSLSSFLSMSIDGATVTLNALYASGFSGADCIQEDFTGVIRSPKVKLPVQPAAGLFVRTETQCSAAGTQHTVAIGRPALRKS